MSRPRRAQIRAFIEDVARGASVRPPATEEQIAAWEKTLGLALPDELREFLVEVGDGGIEMKYPYEMEVFPLFENPSFKSPNRARLVAFPIQPIAARRGEFAPAYVEANTNYARGWSELSSHEQMESEVALHFGMWQGEEVILVLSGRKRGSVCFMSRFGGVNRPHGLTFCQALDHMLSTIS